jgi:ABC-type transporter Mla maintaining outer membrane lipid asymmetry permease subunit MlaE
MVDKKSLAVHLDSLVPSLSAPGGRLERSAVTVLGSLGAAASLAWACFRALRHPRIYLPLTFAQVWEIGIASLPLVLLVAMISGAVTSEQTGYQYSSTLPPWVAGAFGAAAFVRDVHAQPHRYIRISLF